MATGGGFLFCRWSFLDRSVLNISYCVLCQGNIKIHVSRIVDDIVDTMPNEITIYFIMSQVNRSTLLNIGCSSAYIIEDLLSFNEL